MTYCCIISSIIPTYTICQIDTIVSYTWLLSYSYVLGVVEIHYMYVGRVVHLHIRWEIVHGEELRVSLKYSKCDNCA